MKYKFKGYHFGIVLVSLALGLMLAMQFRINYDTSESLPIARTKNLVAQTTQKQEEMANLQRKVTDLRAKLDQTAADQSASLKAQLGDARILAGTQAVSGPGVQVTLNDSNITLGPGQDPNLYVLHDEDVLRVINELKAAGAEAMALNGERLLATSEIRCIGPTILTNKNKRLSAPFTISAIGNPETLENALYMKGGVVDQLKFWGIQIAVTRQTKVVVPSYAGPITFDYAKPVS